MFKVTLLMTTLICRELGEVSAYPDISDNELYYSQTRERLPTKKLHYQLKEVFKKPNVRVNTVAVTCYPTCMVITVKADLFNMSIPVNAADLRLGTETQHGTSCGVIATSNDEYIIEAALTDCGTQHWVTEDALIYTNLVIYSPVPSLDGLVKTEDAVIPIKCHYGRRFKVDAYPILPAWVPHQTTQFAAQNLDFSLRLMTSDWREIRPSSMYFLGDMINMEASICMPQMDLLLFIETCIATTSPNTNSVPRYKFVDNGCMVDGQQTGSKSRFLHRTQSSKLQLQLEAFIFNQMNCEIYITCTLKAYPLNHVSGSMSKACSFIDGSWQSAEGDDWTCNSCDERDQEPRPHRSQMDFATPTYSLEHNATKLLHLTEGWAPLTPSIQADSAVLSPMKSGSIFSQTLQEPAAAWRSPLAFQEGTNQITFEQEASVGPLTIFTKKNKVGVLVPPSVKEGSHRFSSVGSKKPIPHDRLWENEAHTTMEAAEGSNASKSTDTPAIMATSESRLWEMETSVAEAWHTDANSSETSSVTRPSLMVASPEVEGELLPGTAPSMDPSAQC